jgi:hypothetical protein
MPVQAEDVGVLVERIKPILAGHDPELQGAVLADLLAMWLVGHPPIVRESVLRIHIQFARDLVAPNEKLMFGDKGYPSA